MKFEKAVLEKIDLIDSILEEMKIAGLLKNPDFLIDKNRSWEHYVQFKLKKLNAPELSIITSYTEMSINIDRTNELFHWSNKQIIKYHEEIKECIKIIFTKNISIDYCGSNYTKINFMDSEGQIERSLKYVTG